MASRFYSLRTTLALAYVDLNAVRAGMVADMVKRAADYAWSAAAHCGVVAAPPEWLDWSRVSRVAWRERLEQPQPRREMAALRRATRTEYPPGGPGLVEELEAKFQIRLRPLPPGPPAKKPARSQEVESEVSRHAGQSG